jgi:hypothetical protein
MTGGKNMAKNSLRVVVFNGLDSLGILVQYN